MRRLLVGVSLAAMFAASALVHPVTAVRAAAPAAQVWTEPSSTSIFQDTLPGRGSGNALQLDTGTNEYESAQIVVRPAAGLTITFVEFSALSSGANAIAAGNLRSNFLTYQKLNTNTNSLGVTDIYPVTRSAPADFPDNLSNLTRISVPRGVTQSIWITAYVPKNTAAGRYTGSVQVHTDKGDLAAVPLSVDVRAVAIPDPADGVFNNAMWNTFFGEISWAPDGQTIKQIYGYEPFSGAKWNALMEDAAAQMKAHRNNDLTLPLVQMLLIGNSTLGADGKYQFDWTYVDQAIEFFLSRNVTKRLEGFWVCADVNGNGVRDVETIGRDANGKAIRSYVPWNSAASNNFIDQFIPALKAHIQSKTTNGRKWSDMYWMHIGDEPITDSEREAWLGLAGHVRSLWPGVKLGDALDREPAGQLIAPAMDVIVAQTTLYNTNPTTYDRLRQEGKELWFYTATAPRGNYPNRFIDQPQWDQRIMIWDAYAHGATGYLQYSLNGWLASLDGEDAKGDHYIIWPDVPNNRIQSTIRWDSLRDGIEDYEILNILGRTNPGLAKDLATALIQDPDTYSPDIPYQTRIRRLLLDAAAGKPIGSPVSTSSPVDLGRQTQLDGVLLNWGSVYGKDYKLQLSYDGSRWTDAYATTTGDGGDDFIGVNGKARYLRVVVNAGSAGTTPYVLNSLKVAGLPLAKANLLGGRTYAITDGTNPITPADKPDSGIESTDGVLADEWTDGRTYGFGPGQNQVDVNFDLGAAQSVGSARIHAYQEFPGYRPDQVRVSTSTDGVNYVQRGATLTAPNDQSRIWYELDFAAANARFVKVTFQKTYGGQASTLLVDEIEAY